MWNKFKLIIYKVEKNWFLDLRYMYNFIYKYILYVYNLLYVN